MLQLFLGAQKKDFFSGAKIYLVLSKSSYHMLLSQKYWYIEYLRKLGITREEQDAYGINSYKRAAQAYANGDIKERSSYFNA